MHREQHLVGRDDAALASRAPARRSRASGSTPPITSTKTSIDGSPSTASGSVVSSARSSSGTRSLSASRTSTRATSSGAPTLCARYSAFACSSWTTPPPTVPQPRSPRRMRLHGLERESTRKDPRGQTGREKLAAQSRRTRSTASVCRQLSGRRQPCRPARGLGLRLGHLLEGGLEDLVHLADEDELELVLHLGRHLVEVGLVALGDDHALDAGAVRREDLLLEAADGQDAAAERDLAGHRHVVADADAGEQRDERGEHRHAGARPVLGHARRRGCGCGCRSSRGSPWRCRSCSALRAHVAERGLRATPS